MARISIIGTGSWGTALATVLERNQHEVMLWCRRQELADEINNNHTNKNYLENIDLSKNIKATIKKEDTKNSNLFIFAVPSQFLRETAKQFSDIITKDALIVHVVKGIEGTGKLMSEVLKEELQAGVKIAVLAGPNHAEEVAKNLPTATVIASEDELARDSISKLFDTTTFKAYPLEDITGVEVCGAIKNIVAVAMGVCDGLKFGDNAQGSILTLGLSEMSAIAKTLGAKKTTCYGLAGVGDLVATCYSKHSRNRLVGERLAEGKNMSEIQEEMHGMIAEGVKNTKVIYDLMKKQGMETPLITQTYKVLYENLDLKMAISGLLNKI
ncbi:NAD(P)-dependent glycerol-3-phosphate dehydrogenase [Candidatus Woesearchaeota archaeon]|nr:NAD(P)-dependent glycerol-3-phosphate dehydrogenase [Candidatus Woesearchaeota archaeon]